MTSNLLYNEHSDAKASFDVHPSTLKGEPLLNGENLICELLLHV